MRPKKAVGVAILGGFPAHPLEYHPKQPLAIQVYVSRIPERLENRGLFMLSHRHVNTQACIDSPMRHGYTPLRLWPKPATFSWWKPFLDRKRRDPRETDVSTEQIGTQASPRVPRAHGNQRWP